METIEIDLKDYKNENSSIFMGRPQGEAVREKINLDKLDANTNSSVVFNIPDDTISLNPSFYLGLLYKSYKNLGIDGFMSKYHFVFETKDEAIKRSLKLCLEDGNTHAIISLKSETRHKFFF